MRQFKELYERLPDSRYWTIILLGIAMCGTFFILLFRIWIISLYDAEIGGWEYEIIYEAQKIMITGLLYTDPGMPPFHITQKTPLYQYLIAGLACVNKSFFLEEPIRMFWLSRSVSLLISIGAAMVFFMLLRKHFAITSAIAAVGALLCFGGLGQHYYARMDGLYILLFLTLLFTALSSQPAGWRKAFLLALLTSLAVLTKQSGVFYIPIVMGLLATVEDKPVKAIGQYLLLGAVMAALLWVFWVHAHLDLLYKNLVLGLAFGKHWGFLSRVLLSESFGPLFLFGGVAGILLVKDRRPTARALAVFLLLTVLMSLFLLRNRGAGLNYITEFRLAVILSIAFILEHSRLIRPALRQWGFALFAAYLSFANVVYVLSMRAAGQWQNDEESYRQQALAAGYISDNIAPDEYVYWIGEESFFGNFLFPNAVFPVKVTLCMIIRHNPETIGFHNFLSQMNSGGIRYLILEENGLKMKDACFRKPFQGFQKRKVIGRYQIWEWEGG